MQHTAGQELRPTDRPIFGASATNVNGIAYVYGGYYNTAPWNMEALWALSDADAPLIQLSTDPYASPAIIYGQLLSPNNQTLYAFGGHHPTEIIDGLPPEPLRYYRLSLDTLAWTPLQKNISTGGPLERYWHSVVLSPAGDMAYLFGGMNVSGPLQDYFWIYNVKTDVWVPGPLGLTLSRCGHTASMLSNGWMVLLGGYQCIGNYTTNPITDKLLFPMNQTDIFDSVTGRWHLEPLGGLDVPLPRIYHSAVTTASDQIVICGGQDGAAQPFHNYLSASFDRSSMTAVLDTVSWTWWIPPPSPYQPFPRSFATAALINGTRMMYGFGINYHTIYDGIYIFDTVTDTWLPPGNEAMPEKMPYNSNVVLASVIVAFSVMTALLVMIATWYTLKRMNIRLRQVLHKFKEHIWKPRAGEPKWAEICRLVFCALFSVVFAIVLSIMVIQVLNSPIIDQKYYSHTPDYTVDVPDIRFCFDEWPQDNGSAQPYIECSTDFGDNCSSFLLNITDQVQNGLAYYGAYLTCYLFRTPTQFRLSRTSDRRAGNGSYLNFYYYAHRQANISKIHATFYNKHHDPNIPVYDIPDRYPLPFRWNFPDENAAFQSAEQENLRTDNAFDLDPNVVSTASYELIETEVIQSSFWNYAGVAPVRDRVYGITSTAMSEAVSANFLSDPAPLGALHVYPVAYQVTVLRQQRAFTAMNAMGIVGGIFGLMVGLQTCLFGYRPRSPWGIVHRWSVGQMRRSLLHGLRAKFPQSVNVPIVHPVHHRFSVKEAQDPHWKDKIDNEERISKLEERLHVFELLFQAYYIDDEVFRSLANALQADVPKEDHWSPNKDCALYK